MVHISFYKCHTSCACWTTLLWSNNRSMGSLWGYGENKGAVAFLSPFTSKRHVFNPPTTHRSHYPILFLLSHISNSLVDTDLVSQNIQTSYFNCTPWAQLQKTANGQLWKTKEEKSERTKGNILPKDIEQNEEPCAF
jgi:hypothetical protein